MTKLIITNLNHQGKGIAKLSNKVTFVENALENEEVEITNLKEYKNYNEASVSKYIVKSSKRCKYDCIYYDKCGGCNIAHMSYKDQLEFKRNKVIDIFNKYTGLLIEPEIVPTNEYNYRNKMVFRVENNQIGMYKSGTNSIIPINRCLIAKEEINNVINILQNNIDISKVKEITIRTGHKEIMIIIKGKIDETRLKEILPNITSLYVNDKLIQGKKKIIEVIGDYKFKISPTAFFQVNTTQAYNLYSQITKYVKNANKLLDLYCGTGTISIFLSKYAKHITGIEINKEAIKDANENKLLNNVTNIDFISASASVISKMKLDYDVIVVDPPRSGLDKTTINTILNSKVKTLVYISCDPMTLARDIKILNTKYQLEDIKLFDMFANDYHVECVSVLSRKS